MVKIKPTKRRITLPEGEEMFARLIGVNADENLFPRFYKTILQSAGTEECFSGIVRIMATAVAEHAGNNIRIREKLSDEVPKYIMSLVDDKDVAITAKVYFKSMIRKIRKASEREECLLPDAELLD